MNHISEEEFTVYVILLSFTSYSPIWDGGVSSQALVLGSLMSFAVFLRLHSVWIEIYNVSPARSLLEPHHTPQHLLTPVCDKKQKQKKPQTDLDWKCCPCVFLLLLWKCCVSTIANLTYNPKHIIHDNNIGRLHVHDCAAVVQQSLLCSSSFLFICCVVFTCCEKFQHIRLHPKL